MSVVACDDLFRVHRTPEGDAAALQGLTLRVEDGESLAVLGPSGSGKSSLLRVLAGFDAPSAGRAAVFGHDLSRASTRTRTRIRRELLGLVQQHPERALAPDLRIQDTVALPLTLRGRGHREARHAADRLLERVGLADLRAAAPADLSGGERQRAAIAAAIVHGPKLLLADEPTGELDAESAGAVLALLAELARENGMAMLLVTHDPATAAAMNRRVHVRDGRVSDEELDGRTTVVVGRGGWLRIPAALLDAGGIGDRARVGLDAGRVVLEATSATGTEPDRRAPGAPPPATAPGGVTATVRGVRRVHGPRTVLDAFDAAFLPGTFTVLSGRSGSGKSTLLRILTGLEQPDAGVVELDGVPQTERDRTERAVLRGHALALVAQGDVLLPELSVLEQSGVEAARLEPWLDALGLADRARQPVRRLSGGERQRAAIARALASGRRLIGLDEPTSRLDQASALTLALLLRAVAREHGRTVICATHDPVLAAHADRELLLPSGELRPRV